MAAKNTVVEITYNSRGLNEIVVGDISLDIGAIKGRSIQEWFTPFKGRISWKGLIPEIKEALQDSDARFEFEFIGREEHKKIFEQCLRNNGFYNGDEDTGENSEGLGTKSVPDNSLYEKGSNLSPDEILKKAKRLENLGKTREALEQYLILAQQGNAEGEYKSAKLRSQFLKEGNEKHSEHEKYQIFMSYEAAAKHGHTEAMRCLGECYWNGDGVDEDSCEAAAWFKKAAEAGDIESVRYVGYFYETGYGVDKDENEAIDWYKKAIYENDAISGFRLGQLYLFGDTINEDKEAAKIYLKKSAELGNANAQYLYSEITDERDGIEWLKKAADQNQAAAQYSLGRRYLTGDGVKKDEKEGIELIQKSAEQENEDAQWMLGICYFRGIGFEEDNEKAYKWFNEAKKNGSVDAIYYLGVCFENGYGVEVDEIEAFILYEMAADKEYDDAQYRLGECYYNGIGIYEDKEEAVCWYKKAADNGNSDAQVALGQCYFGGQGVEKNEQEAAKCFLAAANQGNSKGQRFLGICYEFGNGIEKNLEEAFQWYKKAANQEDANAQLYLGNCYSNGKGVEKDPKEAVKWYRKSAEQNSTSSQLNLGWHYAHGEGIERSDADAFYWLKKAGDTESNDGDTVFKVACNYDYLLMPEEVRKKISKEEKKASRRFWVGTGLALVGLFVATPLAIAGSVTELSGALGGDKAEKKHYQEILKTTRGKEMMAFYEKASKLGSKDAEKRLKELRKY